MAYTLYQGKTTPAASVTVYWYGTTTKPTIYAKSSGTAKSNPITADWLGDYSFYAADGHYTISNGSTSGDVEVHLTEVQESLTRADKIAMTPFLNVTSTTVQGFIEGAIAAPTFAYPLTITDTTAGTIAGVGSIVSSGGAYFAKTVYTAGNLEIATANNAEWEFGQSSELVTCTGTAAVLTTGMLLPANSIIDAVVGRVVTAITTSTSWSLGDATTAARFAAANSTMTAGATSIGIDHWSGAVATLATGPSQLTAAAVKVTLAGGTAAAGTIRITSFYRKFIAPTS